MTSGPVLTDRGETRADRRQGFLRPVAAAAPTATNSARWLALVVIGVLVCLLRPVDPGERFTFGSEDGTVFAPQARSLGVWDSLHTTYAGYLHLLPRLVAAVASAFPLGWSPPVFYLAATVVAATAAAVSWHCAQALGLSTVPALLLAGAVLLLPAAGYEVVGNMPNVQWYCLAASVVFVAAWLGGYAPRASIACPLLAIAGLTTPLVAVTLPFVLIVAFLRRRRLDPWIALTIAGTACVQGLARLQAGESGDVTVGAHQLLRLFTFRVADGSLFGNRLLRLAYDGLGAVGAELLGALVAVALFVLALRATARLRLICLFLLTSSGLLLLVAVALRPSWFDWPGVGYTAMEGHLDLFNGRYMGVPALCLLISGLLLADHAYRVARHGALRRLLEFAAATTAVMLLANLPVNLYRPALSDWRAQVAHARAACDADGGNGTVDVVNGPFTGFHLVLTCRQAFG